MSFYFNGSQANVSISGGVTTTPNISQPTATQTMIQASQGSLAAGVSTGVTIYTVTAGKTLYVTQVIIGSANAAGYGEITVDGVIKLVAPTPNANSIAIGGGGVLFSVAATKALIFTHSYGAGAGCVCIYGYEV